MINLPIEVEDNIRLIDASHTFSTAIPAIQTFLIKHRHAEVCMYEVLCSGFFEGVIKGMDALRWPTNLLVSRKRAEHCLSILYDQDLDQRFLADYSQAQSIFEDENTLKRIDSENGVEFFLGMCWVGQLYNEMGVRERSLNYCQGAGYEEDS